jgi:transcriptional regulator GlxA family with amidase domain
MISKYCDDDQVQAITCSEAGEMNARKEAVSILAERLQINPRTIERYFRQSTSNKDTKKK